MSHLSRAQILIVEDDLDIAQLLARVFGLGGYSTAMAPDARSALEVLATEPPDLMTLDINLPDMSGVEVLSQVRRAPQHQALPVIVLTSRDDLPQQVQRQATAVMTKPFEIAGLLAAAAALLADAPLRARAVGE